MQRARHRNQVLLPVIYRSTVKSKKIRESENLSLLRVAKYQYHPIWTVSKGGNESRVYCKSPSPCVIPSHKAHRAKRTSRVIASAVSRDGKISLLRPPPKCSHPKLLLSRVLSKRVPSQRKSRQTHSKRAIA